MSSLWWHVKCEWTFIIWNSNLSTHIAEIRAWTRLTRHGTRQHANLRSKAGEPLALCPNQTHKFAHPAGMHATAVWNVSQTYKTKVSHCREIRLQKSLNPTSYSTGTYQPRCMSCKTREMSVIDTVSLLCVVHRATDRRFLHADRVSVFTLQSSSPTGN